MKKISFVLYIFFQILIADTAVDQLTEEAQLGISLQKLLDNAREAGVDLSDPDLAKEQAIENGIPLSTLEEWQRLHNVNQNTTIEISCSKSEEESASAPVQKGQSTPLKIKEEGCYFGYNLFDNVPNGFGVSDFGAVNDGYVINSKDILRLVVWGATEFQYELEVDEEGRIFVPKVGQFTIANMKLENARENLKNWLSQRYQELSGPTPTMFMDLTVTRIKPIKIFVLGEVNNPGGYLLKSVPTAFNALYSTGGIKTTGSLRNIKIIRDGVVIDTLDMYDYLVDGQKIGKDIELQNNDKIFVPVRGKTAFIGCEIMRPCTYELKNGETLKDLIRFAGGITTNAYLKYITIKRIAPLEKRIIRGSDHCRVVSVEDLCFKQMLRGEKTHQIVNGDSVCVLGISDLMENYITLEGAVCKPGRREYQDLTNTVLKLIDYGGDGLLNDAYLKRVEIYRLEKDQTRSLIKINLEKALAGDPRHNIETKPRDIVRVFHINEIIDSYKVSITGPVKKPGNYELLDNMTINDLLFKAGGLFDEVFKSGIYLDRADLIRKMDDGINDTTISFNLEDALKNMEIGKKLLQPYDRIVIYPRDISRIKDKYITISGYVKSPGRYNYTNEMTLEDLIVAAGGFREGAFLESVELNRPIRHKEFTPTLYMFDYIHVPLLESCTIEEISHNLDYQMKTLQIARKFKLQHRDIIRIKQDPDFQNEQTVKLKGEVYFPGQYTLINEAESLYDLLERAGGLKTRAFVKGIEVRRNNERMVINPEKLLRLKDDKNYLILQGNDEINIPKKPQLVKVSGNVGSIGNVQYEKGKKLWYYIARRGGLRSKSKYIYIIEPNGDIHRSRKAMGLYVCSPSCGLFLCNPVIEDGSEIIVTKKPLNEVSTASAIKITVGQALTLAVNALVVIVLVSRL